MISASLVSISLLLASAPERSTTSALFAKVRDCVFEVVVPKYVDTGVKYAEPLPFERLSFQERNDSVRSIGSAFAIGKDTVVTAAHVLLLGENDPKREPLLRDRQGKMYRIKQFLRYSSHQDFAIFTVSGLAIKQPLRPAKNPEIGQVVHAVGNAMGEGIVLRDGLLTSQTPEGETGEWKYWRFSAAASPGNSGGPLVDAKGGLLGVVQMKSESENLNYALPWTVMAGFPNGKGRYREHSGYTLPGVPEHELSTILDTLFEIPRTWTELDRKFFELSTEKTRRDRDSCVKTEAAEFFPKGMSAKLRMGPLADRLPISMEKAQDGWWLMGRRKTGDPMDLGNHGVWISNNDDNFMRVSIRLPEGDRMLDYADSSVKLGDMLLKGGKLVRDFADKEIRVTSLGKAVFEELRTDRWGRPYLVRSWRQPWNGRLLLAYLFPSPDGFKCLIRLLPENHWRGYADQRMDDVIGLTLTNWRGTGHQWREWLARPKLVPSFLRGVKTLDSLVQPEMSWDGNTLRLIPEVAPAGSALFFAYPGFRDVTKDSVSMAITGVAVGSEANTSRRVVAQRMAPPSPSLSKETILDWRHHVEEAAPNDGSSVTDPDDGEKSATRPVASTLKFANVDPTKSSAIWITAVNFDATASNRQVEKSLQKVIQASKFATEPVVPR